MPRSTLTNRHRPSACAAVAVSSASYNAERGPRTCPSSSWITTAGDRPKLVPASADSARYVVPSLGQTSILAVSRTMM